MLCFGFLSYLACLPFAAPRNIALSESVRSIESAIPISECNCMVICWSLLLPSFRCSLFLSNPYYLCHLCRFPLPSGIARECTEEKNGLFIQPNLRRNNDDMSYKLQLSLIAEKSLILLDDFRIIVAFLAVSITSVYSHH